MPSNTAESALVLHPITKLAVSDYIAQPAHALLITGPTGSGKSTVVQYIGMNLLQIRDGNEQAYAAYPYLRVIRPVDNKAIPIETIRELQQFLSLKVPGSKTDAITRLIVIEEAHLLTHEAQNALLKTLEEPPTGTALILTTTSTEALLPTIQSRVAVLALLPPPIDALTDHFVALGYSGERIRKVLMLSGALPGLASALLTEDQEHSLVIATEHARAILQSKSYERLLLVDSLSKQKQVCLDVLFVLGQMSHMALLQAKDQKSADRWKLIMQASYTATRQLNHNAQTKLVLSNLMLTL